MGRIDVHAHLLPGIDDGSKSVNESVGMARKMVAAGYSDLFCTPHIWPTLTNNMQSIKANIALLQGKLDAGGVPLKLHPGGEMNLRVGMEHMSAEEVVTYNDGGKYAIFDFWADEYPGNFWPFIERLQSFGIQPILAHPERISALQRYPHSIDEFPSRGLLIQCNLECLGEETVTIRRKLAERWLQDGEYFMLGSDMHGLNSLDRRLNGLLRAMQLVGEEEVTHLTVDHPAQLLT